MATLLPNGEQQFTLNDGTGAPAALGSVYFYVPSTLTPKDTWTDSGQSTLNINPVPLDANGRAIIYGAGLYRQIVKDAAGNTIWDQLTADTASGGIIWGGVSGGTANAQTLSASSFSQIDGQVIDFIAGFTNASQLTLTIGGGSPIPVLQDTQSGPSPLVGYEVVAANAYSLIYEASRGAFHLVNPTSATNSGSAGNRYAAASGTNTVTATFSPPLAAYTTGQPLYVKLGGTNTTTATFNANGLGAKTIKTLAGANLIASQLLNGNIAVLVYDGTNFQLLNPAPVQYRYIGTQIITTTATYTATAGTIWVRAWVQAGGGGGGAASTGNTDSNCGVAGGGAGGRAHWEGLASSASGQTATVGAAGAGAATITTAGTGGTSSLGALAVAAGGPGAASLAGGSDNRIVPPTAGGTASAGTLQIGGQPGGGGAIADAAGAATNGASGGNGGSTPWGSGGKGGGGSAGTGSAGSAASGYGAGGGGAGASNSNTAVLAGGAGVLGIIIIEEFGLA